MYICSIVFFYIEDIFWATKKLAPGGIEPTTFALLARRSNQLSYGAEVNKIETIYVK